VGDAVSQLGGNWDMGTSYLCWSKPGRQDASGRMEEFADRLIAT